jgi:hypothetical protein
MACGCRIEAQTNAVSITNTLPVITTNVWIVRPWYREINGQVYDPWQSALWKPIKGMVEVKKVLPDNTYTCQWCERRDVNGPRGTEGEYVVYGKKFVLCHWLSTPPPSIGEQIEFIGEPYAMYIGNTNLDGEVLPVWDCGNVIKSNTVTITTTNYPPQPATTKNL